MDPLINQNLEDRERTRAALTQKLELLELRLRDSIDKVKEAMRRSTDVPYQVKQRPWTMFGLSVLLGCAAASLARSRHTRRSASAAKLAKSMEQGIDAVDQMVRKIGNVDYANQLSVIKQATIGTMASLVSELARRVPAVLAQVEEYAKIKMDGKALKKEATDAARLVEH
jgi:hypothetical protein